LQVEKPTGFFGKILARGMAWGYRSFYKTFDKMVRLTSANEKLLLKQ